MDSGEITTSITDDNNEEDDTQNYLLEASDFLLDDDDDNMSSNTATTKNGDVSTSQQLPASYISAQRIASLRITHRRHATDVGSPEYQVAGMTERISHLTNHLKAHPKDFSTRRGLVALVNKRRRLLNYLFVSDTKGYVEIVAALGIRHKVPGAIPSKEDEYGEFPGQKKINRGKSKMKGNNNSNKRN